MSDREIQQLTERLLENPIVLRKAGEYLQAMDEAEDSAAFARHRGNLQAFVTGACFAVAEAFPNEGSVWSVNNRLIEAAKKYRNG